jgi:hypothetical protein
MSIELVLVPDSNHGPLRRVTLISIVTQLYSFEESDFDRYFWLHIFME